MRTPRHTPRANAICERMIATLRRELLDRVLVVNERHLRRILTIYLHHFNNALPRIAPRSTTQVTPTALVTARPSPPTSRSARRADQRIRPGRMGWMTYSTPTGGSWACGDPWGCDF